MGGPPPASRMAKPSGGGMQSAAAAAQIEELNAQVKKRLSSMLCQSDNILNDGCVAGA